MYEILVLNEGEDKLVNPTISVKTMAASLRLRDDIGEI